MVPVTRKDLQFGPEMHGPIIFFVRSTEKKYHFLFVSENIQQLGFSSHELTHYNHGGDTFLKIEEHNRVEATIQEGIHKGLNGYTVAYQLRTPKGFERDIVEYGSIIYSKGKPSQIKGYLIDRTDDASMQLKAAEWEKSFKELIGSSLAGSYIVVEEAYAYVNHQFASVFGYTPEQLMGEPAEKIAAPQERKKVLEYLRKSTKGQKLDPYLFKGLHRKGYQLDVQMMASLMTFQGQQAIIGTVIDLLGSEDVLRRLKMSEAILENTIEGVVVTDNRGIIEWVNPAFTEITGYAEGDAIGKNPRILKSNRHSREFYEDMWKSIQIDGFWKGEIWNRRKNGEVYPELLTIAAIRNQDEETVHYVSIFNDMTERVKTEEKLEHQKYHDALTALPNRFLLTDRISVAMAGAQSHRISFALFFIDVDRFRRINDTLGHLAGDRVIGMFATRLQNVMREEDTISRLVGDEFAILVNPVNHVNTAVVIAEKILKSLEEPFFINNQEIYMTVSIGVGIYPGDGQYPEELIKHAEIAMLQAKKFGKNRYRLYSEDMHKETLVRLEMENDIRKGLEEKEFEMYYQPQIEVVTGEIKGAESLMRWRHLEKGQISPGIFIPAAEESGLMIPLGIYTMNQVFEQVKSWCDAGLHKALISFNLSPTQFQQMDLFDQIKGILSETQADPAMLELEITENTAMVDIDYAIRSLKRIKELGIRVAMDDFGTGYSSLALLSRLPVDKLKIDRSFVSGIEKSPDKQTIVAAMVGMSHQMGMDVVAEGVEEKAERDFLLEIGCNMIQGFYYSPAVPADRLEKMMRHKVFASENQDSCLK